MEDTREDVDTRSPKRQAQPPAQSPQDSAAHAVAALDAAIWTSIIEFLPMPKEIELATNDGTEVEWDARIAHYDSAVSELLGTWRTLLNLRLVSKELATLLHPVVKKALWKRLLLQGFDFTVGDDTFSVENHLDQCGLDEPSDDEETSETDTQSEQDPQLVAMRGRYTDIPDDHLEEELASWPKLGIYHRPSQYGFLTQLQQQPAEAEWPESEDPFSLFADLVRLLMLPHGEGMEAGGEGCDTTVKYLAAPTEADSSSEFYRFYVMKTLGYIPHFWHCGSGIGEEWKGFTEPEELKAVITNQLRDDPDEDAGGASFEDGEDEAGFPNCNVGNALLLYGHIRQHFRDWRSVCCNEGSDGYTPVFFVGESKALPHRWIGYAGQKCWS